MKNIIFVSQEWVHRWGDWNKYIHVWIKLVQWFYRRRFLDFIDVFWLFHYTCNIPLEKWASSFEHDLILSLLKNALCQVRLKLAQWFWTRRLLFVNFVNVFSLFRYYLPLEKVGVLHWKTLNFIHQRMLYVKFGWTGLVVLEKKKM